MDVRPTKYYPHTECQRLVFPDGTVIPIEYDGVFPFIQVRCPTHDEIQYCKRLVITDQTEWNPHNEIVNVHNIDVNNNLQETSYSDPISSFLNCDHFPSMFDDTSFMPGIGMINDDYYTISAINSSTKAKLSPQDLSKMWKIGLSTAKRTQAATTHKCFRTTGLLSRRFKTDMAQLKYKQLSKQYGTFYVDYLKSAVKSLRGLIEGTLYTNKTGYEKFFLHQDERGSTTASALRSFIEVVGLPASIHSDGHQNFVEGEYKKSIRKYGLQHTHTEAHSRSQRRL